MEAKTESPKDMTEYKFAESEGVVESSADQQAQDSIPEDVATTKFSWKKIIVPAVIVLLILFIYLFFSFYSARKNRAMEQKKVVVQEIIPSVVAIPPLPVVAEPVVVQPSPASPPAIDVNQIKQAQEEIHQKLNDVVQEITNNREKISNLIDTVSKSQQDVAAISQNISQLTVTLQQVLIEVEKLKVSKIKPKKRSKPLDIYHIRAIIPGRVWLESDSGKSVTLRVGDSLNGYGRVEVISPQQGLVVMSNGSYIQYGVNDF